MSSSGDPPSGTGIAEGYPPPLRAVNRGKGRFARGKKDKLGDPVDETENTENNNNIDPSDTQGTPSVAERLRQRRAARGGGGDESAAGSSTDAPRRLGTRAPGRAVPNLRISEVGASTGGAVGGVTPRSGRDTARTDRSGVSHRSEPDAGGNDGDGRIARRGEGETRFSHAAADEEDDVRDDIENEEENTRPEGAPQIGAFTGATMICQADIPDPQLQAQLEAEMLFRVSGMPARLAVTNDAVKVLNERFRAHLDEGLYVGKIPTVPSRNRNRFEQRLLKEETEGRSSVRWFDKGGEIELSPDPVDYMYGKRSGHWYDPDAEYLQTKFLRPDRRIEGARVIRAQEKHYRLEMDVRDLTFYDHPLFTEEHYEAQRLMVTYTKYRARQELDLPNFYTDRLMSLRQELARLKARTAELPNLSMSMSQLPGVADRSLDRSESFSMSASFASAGKRGLSSKALSDERRDLEQRENSLRNDVRALRDLRDAEEYTDLLLVREIIATWGKIKRIRTDQGFVATNTKLVIRRSRPEETLDKIYDREIEQEIEERREDHEDEYRRAVRDYDLELSQWRARKRNEEERIRLLKEARETAKKLRGGRRRNTRGQSISTDPTGTGLDAETSQDIERSHDSQMLEGAEDGEDSEEEPIPEFAEPEPEPPVEQEFPEDAIRDEIVERYRRTKRAPGEPVLDPVLTDTTAITRAVQCSRAEQNRRAAVNKLRYIAKVMVNGKLVDKTAAVSLTEDFRLQFRTIFSLQLAHWPDKISIDLFQSGRLDKKVCTIFVRLPGSEEMFLTNAFPESFQFSSSDAFDAPYVPLVNQLGSAPPPSAMQKHFTAGAIDVFMEWQGRTLTDETDASKNQLHPPIPRHKAPSTGDHLGRTGVPSQLKLREWVKSANLDPNDPRNASIIALLKTMEAAESIDTRFRITEAEKNLRFKFTDGPETRRHKLLRMRQEKTVTSRQVPLMEHMITDSMFDPPPNAASIEDKYKIDDKTPDFIKRIREKEIVRNLTEKKRLQTPDCVNEIPVPIFMSLAFLADIGKWFKPRRKLNPRRKTRRAKAQHLENCQLLIQVTRGMNVPVRAKMISGADLPEYPGAVQPTRDQYVSSFVEIEFQGKTTRTHTTEGPNPQWNELLHLPFQPAGDDFSVANLSDIREEVTFSLYDEFVINNPKDDREKNSSYQRKEKRYLGSFRIPFKYLYMNVKVEGTFQFAKPIINMGYSDYVKEEEIAMYDGGARPSLARPSTTAGPGVGGGVPGGRAIRSAKAPVHGPTSVGLFLTFEPLLTKPEAAFGTEKEFRKYSEYAIRWMHGIKSLKHCEDRNILCMAMDIDNRPVSLTRYIYPQAPPAELDTVEKVVRFVAMIPYLDDSVAFIRRNNLWATSKQFMEILAGDAEEHGVLLCNYFLHMKKDAYLVLGTAVPDGHTTYVMTKERGADDRGDDRYTFWNPSTGESWDRWDPHLKLKSIGAIVTSENIYANVQALDAPQLVTLGFQDESAWRPFFSAQYPKGNKFITVQEDLVYTPSPPTFARDLEEKINAAIIRNVENSRERFVTSWNRACSRTLKRLLPTFEEDRQASGLLSVEDHNLALGTILMSSHMHGYPINIPYTDVQSVVNAVLATGIQNTEDENVDFATATYVHSFPNKVAAVWVYICVLKNYD